MNNDIRVISTPNSAKYSALRVDIGRLYDVVPNSVPNEPGEYKVTRAANQVVEDAIQAGFNAIFVIAYSPTHGAYYSTEYKHSKTETGFGSLNILNVLIDAAHNSEKPLEVIASFHVNNFESVYCEQPEWREKQEDGTDYQHPRGTPLSPYHPEYREWFKGLLQDFLTIHPQIDGLEAFEGYVDYGGVVEADFNLAAIEDFRLKHGEAEPLKGEKWKEHRAQGLTELHRILFDVAKQNHKKSFVVQTWTANLKGELWSADEIRDAFGFDFLEIANSKPDAVAAQLIWHQWAHTYSSPDIFTPEWTGKAGEDIRQAFVLPDDVKLLIHVELTDFATEGSIKTKTIPVELFRRGLELALQFADGVTVYDYVLMKKAILNDISFTLSGQDWLNRVETE